MIIGKSLLIFLFSAILYNHKSASQTTYNQCFTTIRECPNENVTFHLYTRDTQSQPVQLDMNQPSSILKAKFADGRPLVILFHGYTGDKDFAPNRQIRPAYFRKGEFNIISVDYKKLAMNPCYPFAVKNLPTVANCTAQLIDFLVDKNVFTLNSIHVIGFSLGAQTSG